MSAETSEIESNESTIAQTIENKRISELPLNGRQVYMLMQLTAGTIFTQTTFGATGFSGTSAWDVNGSLSVHGSRTGNNEYLVDGRAELWNRRRNRQLELRAARWTRSRSSRSARRAWTRRMAARAAAWST